MLAAAQMALRNSEGKITAAKRRTNLTRTGGVMQLVNINSIKIQPTDLIVEHCNNTKSLFVYRSDWNNISFNCSFLDGGFKMVKVLKDMLYLLYQSVPSTLHNLVLLGFLLFDLPVAVDEIKNQLLAIKAD